MSQVASIDYYLSTSSPWAYLGTPRLKAIARRHRVEIVPRPIPLIAGNGGVSIRTRPAARLAYQEIELARWSSLLDLPLNPRPAHRPSDATPANRLVTAAVLQGYDGLTLAFALQRAIWVQERDIAAANTRRAVCDENGMPGAKLVASEGTSEVDRLLAANIERAEKAGVFGVPTYAVDDEIVWGQDQLQFLDALLTEKVKDNEEGVK